MDFHVTGTFELFKDDVVHTAAGIDERGGDDGERAAFFNIAGGAEKPLGALQGVGIDAAGEHLAGGRYHGVVGAGKTGDGIEKDDYVTLVFDQALGLFDDHFGYLDVTGGGLVKGGADHLSADGTLHVGDFFRPLVNQQNDEADFRVVEGDRVCDVL